MATISIEEKVVVIEDPEKAVEIQDALDGNSSSFVDVKPVVENTNTKEIIRKWFSH
ncbi:MAG: hypothetical protein IJS93_03300 [Clostridia bacterium]|nr:hypothetical protein [Clostridia bacterium]